MVIHEAGHRPFGLADEYCDKREGSLGSTCDGGYGFATQAFSNVFSSSVMISCADDAISENKDPTDCETWMDDKDRGPFSTYDPVRNDLMSDRGHAQFLDRRRIEGVLNNCPMGGC